VFVLDGKSLALDVLFEQKPIGATEVSNTLISLTPDLSGIVFSNFVTSAPSFTINSILIF
jgi:hypothetical protein